MDRTENPLKHEDRYFLEKERAAIEKLREAREARLRKEGETQGAEALEALRAAHWMRCPKCGHEMAEVDLSGIRVDRCTRCEGVYFDQGEIEELLLKRQGERRGLLRKLLGI